MHYSKQKVKKLEKLVREYSSKYIRKLNIPTLLKARPSVEENLVPLIDYQMKILKKIIKFFLRNSWTRNMFSCWAANRWLCPFRVAAWKAKKYRTGGRWACWWTIEPRAPSDRAITPVSTSVQYPQKVSWSSTSNSNSGKLPFARL
jgi:hypothetical protein